MEVHHHPRLDHSPKPWKEYFLEFLMIFLAVTMGFFAESLREHISNNEKERQFVVSLVADLNADTAKISNYLGKDRSRMANYKMLLSWLEQPLRNDTAFRGKFYKAAWSTLGRDRVYFTNRIINQLKNSDNFRLIIDQQVANAIMDYSNGTSACDNQADVVDHFTEDCTKPAMEIIDLKAYKEHLLGSGKKFADNTVAFISTAQKAAQAYSNAIYLKVGVGSYYTILIKEQQQRAIKLIKLLNKKYNLD